MAVLGVGVVGEGKVKLRQESRSVSKSHIHSTVQCCLHHKILLFPWRILGQDGSEREEQGFVLVEKNTVFYFLNLLGDQCCFP